MDLIPCNDKETFISDIQKAFQESYEKAFGPCPKTILPRKDIEQSFSTEGAKIFFATENGKIVGGAVVVGGVVGSVVVSAGASDDTDDVCEEVSPG